MEMQFYVMKLLASLLERAVSLPRMVKARKTYKLKTVYKNFKRAMYPTFLSI